MEKFRIHFAIGLVPVVVWLFFYYYLGYRESQFSRNTLLTVGLFAIVYCNFALWYVPSSLAGVKEPTFTMKLFGFLSPIALVTYLPNAFWAVQDEVHGLFFKVVTVLVFSFVSILHTWVTLIAFEDGYNMFTKLAKNRVVKKV